MAIIITDITNIIDSLKKFGFINFPKDEIVSLFKQVGKIGYLILTFHKGKFVMRVGPNYDGERFEKKSDYSFKPQNIIKHTRGRVRQIKRCFMLQQFT